MKKFLLFAVLALSFVSLAACTDKNKDSSSNSSSISSNRPSDDVEVEAGGSYRPEWDYELPEDPFN
jgi:ABC-type oligopeptide transport system substrate-binding subunit